jgi:hypothetical protein
MNTCIYMYICTYMCIYMFIYTPFKLWKYLLFLDKVYVDFQCYRYIYILIFIDIFWIRIYRYRYVNKSISMKTLSLSGPSLHWLTVFQVHIYGYTCIYMYICINMCVCICTYVWIYIRLFVYTYLCVFIYVYKYPCQTMKISTPSGPVM